MSFVFYIYIYYIKRLPFKFIFIPWTGLSHSAGYIMISSNNRNTINKLSGRESRSGQFCHTRQNTPMTAVNTCFITSTRCQPVDNYYVCKWKSVNRSVILVLLSKLDSDLSPDIMPAGISFPDFLYLIPMMTERSPADTGGRRCQDIMAARWNLNVY